MSIYVIPPEERHRLKTLVEHLADTMILSCLQGHMGEAYADDPVHPKSCRLDVVDFSFLCGQPDEEMVAGASSYSYYDGGIEIQIDTREDYRRKGLAYVCASALMLECLKRGLYPGWDAQNLVSAKLAGELGYQYAGEYVAYEVIWK